MTPRTLKVETHWADNTRPHHAPKSKLRLKGAWLREAGFLPGYQVTVTIQDNRLIIERSTQ